MEPTMIEFLKCAGLAILMFAGAVVVFDIRLRLKPQKEKQPGRTVSSVPEQYRQPREELSEINS